MCKRILPLAIIFVAIWVLVWQYAKPNCLDTVQETMRHNWAGRGAYSIKVDRRPDSCSFEASDSYYVFQFNDGRTGRWREVMTYRHRSAVNLENKFVRTVDENTAYVFIFDKIAVTADGGQNWTFWDAKKELAGWKNGAGESLNDVRIETVELDETGRGAMRLEDLGRDQKVRTVFELSTDDFGKTWKNSK